MSSFVDFAKRLIGVGTDPLMTEAAAPAPAQGKDALVVFSRTGTAGGAVRCPVLQLSGNDTLTCCGLAAVGHRFAVRIPAGQARFLVAGGEKADLVVIDAAPSLVYYVEVRPRPGFWKASFEGHPVRADELQGEAVRGRLGKSHWTAAKPELAAWFAAHEKEFTEKCSEALRTFEALAPDRRHILTAADGAQTLF